MTKILIDEAVVTQALEVVQCYAEHAQHTIAALHQALANEALDKMADNAREMGLGYGKNPLWMATHPDQLTTPPAPAQEPNPDALTAAYMSGVYDGKKRKPWVGLTREEIDDIEATWQATQEWVSFSHAARVIEAKLKEKNQ